MLPADWSVAVACVQLAGVGWVSTRAWYIERRRSSSSLSALGNWGYLLLYLGDWTRTGLVSNRLPLERVNAAHLITQMHVV